MKNIFQGGTYQAGIGQASVTLGGRPLRMAQTASQIQAEAVARKEALVAQENANAAMKAAIQAEAASRGGPEARPAKLSPKRNRFQWAVNRLCTMMRKLGESNANPQAVSRVFWAFVKHARASEESVLAAYKTLCPELPVPPKPVKRVPERPSIKVPVTYQEAVQVSTELNKAMETVTEEEVVSRASGETSGALAPEDLPTVEIVKEELAEFVAAGDTGAPVFVDQEGVVAADKAIEQASTIKTEKTTKGLLTAAGVVGAGALLFYIL